MLPEEASNALVVRLVVATAIGWVALTFSRFEIDHKCRTVHVGLTFLLGLDGGIDEGKSVLAGVFCVSVDALGPLAIVCFLGVVAPGAW